MKAIIQAVIAMSPVASDDFTKFSHDGVLIRSKGDSVVLVATDGHRLVERKFTFTMPEGDYIVRSDQVKALKMLLKALPKHVDSIEFTASGRDIVVSCPMVGMTVKIDRHVTEYPHYEQVIPNPMTRTAIAFNARYLLEIAEALVESGAPKSSMEHVRIEFNPFSAETPILIYGQDKTARAVVMPIRDATAKDIASSLKEKLDVEPAMTA